MATHKTQFDLQDAVNIDGDVSIEARITGITIRGRETVNYEVSYFHCGVSYSPIIEEWRLRRAED